MAKRVALIPEELVSSYHFLKPEIRIEDEIESLLEKKELPNDMKVKLLSHLITRYHKVVHTPPEPVRVSVVNEQQETEKSENVKKYVSSSKFDEEMMIKEIMFSVPKSFGKFIPMIVEKLKSRQYSWNELGEMTHEDKPINGSKIVDFFSYIMRNAKTQTEPRYFNYFLKAIKEINIPRTWIANKKVLSRLDNEFRNLSSATDTDDYSDLDSSFLKKKRIRSKSLESMKSPSEIAKWRPRNESSKQKWMEY